MKFYLSILELDTEGCKTGKHCLAKTDPKTNCTNICTKVCQPHKKLCIIVDPETGCNLDSSCIPARSHGGKCEGYCTPLCKEGQEKSCIQFDMIGCPSATCIPNQSQCTSEYNKAGCKNHPDPSCNNVTERACPGGDDQWRCDKPKICISRKQLCPLNCNPVDRLTCSKGEYDGIDLGDFCIFRNAYQSFLNNTACETHCPAACEWSSQKACPAGYDDSTGCPLKDECRPMHLPCHVVKEECPAPSMIPGFDVSPTVNFGVSITDTSISPSQSTTSEFAISSTSPKVISTEATIPSSSPIHISPIQSTTSRFTNMPPSG